MHCLPDRSVALPREALRIVPFRADLREHFHRLNAAWLRKYFWIEEIDHEVLSHPEMHILARGGQIFFALLGDAVVGTCALKWESPDSFELTKMAVSEEHQGLGIGRALIEKVIAEFLKQPARTLFLETSIRLAPALRLYESVGFERQAKLKEDSHYTRADVYMIWNHDALSRARPIATPPE